MTAPAADLIDQPGAAAPKAPTGTPGPGTVPRLMVRWTYLATLTVFAFHQSLSSLVAGTRAGSLNGFVWLTPIAAVLAASGVARRERVELPIHDRQTDVIVGTLGLIVALMVQWVLLRRYAQTFHLLRIDLLAMWLFVVSSSVILFGLRPVIRFRWVWLLMLMSFPLAYQLSVVAFGGNRVSAGLASLVIAAVATAISVGRSRDRAAVGALAATGVGLVVLLWMAALNPAPSLLAFQMIPALAAITMVGVAMFLRLHRGLVRTVLLRKVEPLASGQVWAGVPMVLAAAVALSVVELPAAGTPPVPMDAMAFGRPLAVPAGWRQTDHTEFGWARRLYGRDATLIRQRLVAETGNRYWDKHGRPRTVVVDTTSTWRPFSLQAYPAVVLYDTSNSRISTPRSVDLGHGVTGSLVTVVDEHLLLTWNFMSWTWRNHDSAQRVTVAAVDNHEPDAPFPEPVGGLAATLRTMIVVLFRGNSATWDRDPTFKDADLLATVSRALIDAQPHDRGPS